MNREIGPDQLIGLLLDNCSKDDIISRGEIHYRNFSPEIKVQSGRCYAFAISPADWRLRAALLMTGYEVIGRYQVKEIESFCKLC